MARLACAARPRNIPPARNLYLILTCSRRSSCSATSIPSLSSRRRAGQFDACAGHVGIRNAYDMGHPELGVAAVMSALPLMIPLVIILMRKLRDGVQL